MQDKSVVLTPDEIQQITKYKRHSQQINALAFMGIAYYERPDGSPCVIRDALVQPDKSINPRKAKLTKI